MLIRDRYHIAIQFIVSNDQITPPSNNFLYKTRINIDHPDNCNYAIYLIISE